MMKKNEMKKALAVACKEFMTSGLTVGTWGNISIRQDDVIAITPSGLGYDKLTVGDVVIVGEKSQRRPSSELPLHRAIYAKRPDVQAIVHIHSVFATALATAHKALPVITEDGAALAEEQINCARYALAGSEELAKYAVKALGKNNAVLLANHGAVVCAGTLQQVLLYAQLLEKMAKVYYLAENLGGAKRINKKDLEKLREFYFNTYSKLQEEKCNEV